MTRIFDLSSSIDDTYFPLRALGELRARGQETGVPWLVIGAVARDLVVHLPLGHAPARATKDVDIAIAVPSHDGFEAFARGLERRPSGAHAFSVAGIAVDVVPFGGIEADGTITFSDDHRMSVIGLTEAASSADRVKLSDDLTVSVAAIEAQCPLKVLAWRDRHATDTKDAHDLITLLFAGSEGRYATETWDDESCLDVNDDDILLAGAYRLGREGSTSFSAERHAVVLEILDDEERLQMLVRQARRLGAKDVLDAYVRGFSSLR